MNAGTSSLPSGLNIRHFKLSQTSLKHTCCARSQAALSSRSFPRPIRTMAVTRCEYDLTSKPDAVGNFLGSSVPRMGLGLAALGRPGYINLGHGDDLENKVDVEGMRARAAEVLDCAHTAGLRYYDAARSYGKSEEFLSQWIQGSRVGTEDLLVGSKWGYRYTAEWNVDTGGDPHEVKEHTLAHLQKQTLETTDQLGHHLNLYQIHSATFESGVLENADVVGELARIKREKGWRIGLTLSGVQQAATLRAAMKVQAPDGSPLFDCVQATWNLLEQSSGGALVEAKGAGMDVIVKEAMANGRLTSRNSSPTFAPKLAALQAASEKLGTTVDALALACVLAQPFQAMVLSGASNTEQLLSNTAALEVLERLDLEVVKDLMAVCITDPEEYWKERSALSWN